MGRPYAGAGPRGLDPERPAIGRGFLPLGTEAELPPGDEEYFHSGGDLLITNISIEAACLTAIIAMLGPEPRPEPIITLPGRF